MLVYLERYINTKKYDPYGEFMIKRIITLIIAIVLIGAGCVLIAQGQELDVDMTSDGNSISVIETIPFEAVSGDFLEFWIQDGAIDISVSIYGDSIDYESIGNNRYSSNVSLLYTIDEDILNTNIEYKLNKDTAKLEKTIIYNLSSLKITLDEKEIYSGTNLKFGSAINIDLQQETEVKTEKVETIPIWIFSIIIVLIILLIIALIRPTKKQKSTKKKETTSGSKELLSTKKALLMESLKDIEKKHRAKKISDDTYHKLKDKYKQEAVETMKKLEDIK